VILPIRGIYSNMAQIGGYAKFIAVIAFNRYLEKPTNLCRPSIPDLRPLAVAPTA